jgi:hypothetical protein
MKIPEKDAKEAHDPPWTVGGGFISTTSIISNTR